MELYGLLTTVNKSLDHMERLGIVPELTGAKRNRLFSYAGHLKIMNQGLDIATKPEPIIMDAALCRIAPPQFCIRHRWDESDRSLIYGRP